MTKSKGHSKRPGAQKVQTKRSPMNKHNHEKHACHAKRMLERERFFKLKNNCKVSNDADKFYMSVAPQAKGLRNCMNSGMSLPSPYPSTAWPIYFH